ncbi:hypothetical protein FSW04_01765 [Baekduia soli]|uniref:YtxH domain-containing protein n=1 Tax=Baekduia soli TaxID=496014 RepID=A0A5B8U0A2_9ACTN|nr:hypothetical protein [Baekduia soli]QEC46429.1 hypothetical protein FSW04_01765 [Baekduia soli]
MSVSETAGTCVAARCPHPRRRVPIIGAVAVGLLAGMLLPGTGVEDDRLGPMADQVKEQLKDSGQEALEHGKAVVSETASTAVHAASQTAQEHGAELRHSAQGDAQTAREGISSR